MKTHILLNAVYAVSDNVVVREVEDEVILIPLVTSEDNMEKEPYFLNTTGQIIWQRLNGHKRLKDLVKDLVAEFETPAKLIEKDVIGFVEKLLMRNMIVKVPET